MHHHTHTHTYIHHHTHSPTHDHTHTHYLCMLCASRDVIANRPLNIEHLNLSGPNYGKGEGGRILPPPPFYFSNLAVKMDKTYLTFSRSSKHCTVCPRSLGPFYTVTHYPQLDSQLRTSVLNSCNLSVHLFL